MMTLMVSLNLLFGGKDLTGFYECGTLSKKCLNFKKMLSVLLKKVPKLQHFLQPQFLQKASKLLRFVSASFTALMTKQLAVQNAGLI